MASTVESKVAAAGQSVSNGVERAVEFVKDKTGIGTPPKNRGVAGIKDGMDVIASCGKKVGVVDRVEGSAIKLTRKDSPDNVHHFVPLGWIERVDSHVHLTKNSQDTENGWKADAESCNCSS